MSLSSIFSFSSLRDLDSKSFIKIGKTAGATILAIFFLNLIVGAWEPIPLYNGWENQQMDLKLRLYREFIEERGKIDILLYGNSVVQSINVAWYEESHPGQNISIFNAGIGGLIPDTANFLLQNGFMKEGRPENIVYMVGARDLRDVNGKGRVAYGSAFYRTIAARQILATDFAGKLEAFCERYFYLFGARKALRDWIVHGEKKTSESIEANAYGVSRSYNSVVSVDEFPPDFYYRSRYDKYGIDRERGQYSWMLKFAEYCRQKQINLVFAISPIAPACFSLFDDPDKDYASFRSAMQEISEITGVPLLDVHSDLQLPNQSFSNADHVNGEGAEKLRDYFSERVFPAILEGRLSRAP